MSEYIDIPKEQLLELIEKGLTEQLAASGIAELKNFKVDKLEWTLDGIRIWTQN